jgi:hypothetical protein
MKSKTWQLPNNISRLMLFLVIFIYSCNSVGNNQIDSTRTSTPTPSAFELLFTEVSLEQALPYFQDETGNEIFKGIKEITKSGILSIHTLARFGPTEDNLTDGVYAVLKPGDELTGYLLLVDTLNYSHEFSFIATLDYLPVDVRFNEINETLPKLSLSSNTRRAFRFFLPALPEGLHTLVIKFTIEPDHFFAFDSSGMSLAETEAFNFRDLPFEFGLLVWVTDEHPENPLDWPEQARSIPPENTTLLMDAYLVKEKPKAGQPEMALNKDTVNAGESINYYIHPIASDIGKGDIPLRVLVFWDDILTQVDDLLIPAQAAFAQEYIPYQIQGPANLSEGTHYLTVVGYPYPYYLRGWGDGSEWRTDVGPFSNLMARIPVDVQR